MPLPVLTLKGSSKPESRPPGLTSSTKLLLLQVSDFATLHQFNCWQSAFTPLLTTHAALLSLSWTDKCHLE